MADLNDKAGRVLTLIFRTAMDRDRPSTAFAELVPFVPYVRWVL